MRRTAWLHDLEVVREIEARRSVQESAVLLHEADELHLAQVARALEHQVLEKVRESRSIARLDAKADAVVHGDHRGGDRALAREYDLEPVGKLVLLHGHMERGGA